MSMTLRATGTSTGRRELAVLLMVAALAALVAVLYADSFLSIAGMWRYSEYRHGAVVFPASAFLLWRARKRLAGAEVRPNAFGIVLVVVLVLLWLVARSVGVQVAEHLAAVLLITATIVAFLGWPFARRALFPLLFTVAAVPVGDALIPHLMRITADMATALLQAAAVPVFRQGQFLSLPGGDFEIADVCSGLRYLIVGTIIASLFAYLTYRSNVKRAAFVAAMAAAMIVANGVRAFIVMFVASATDMRYLAGRDHLYFGWLLFGVVIGALIYVGTRFADPGRAPSETSAQRGRSKRRPLLPPILVLLPAAAALAAGPVLESRVSRRPLEQRLLAELPAIEACGGAEEWAERWRPEFQSPDIALSGTYLCSGKPVNVFIAGYLGNTQGRELISDANKLIPDAWRRFSTEGRQRFLAPDGRAIDVNEVRVDGPGGQRAVVWYWYTAGGGTVTTPTAVKLRQALQLVLHGHSDGTAYLLQTPVDGAIEASRERLASAAREIAASSIVGGDEERT